MTPEQKEQIWNALWSGKFAALELHQLTRHTEGSASRLHATEKEINAAMDLVSTDSTKETNRG